MRDTSLDVDDPNVSMTDITYHKSYIYSHCHASTNLKHMLKVENDRLIFMQGNFLTYALKQLIKPTMKGFWVPVRIDHGASLKFTHDELIGLQNCGEHVGGKISIASKKIKTFQLVPITFINELDIESCEHLLDFDGMPNVLTSLTINYQQLKHNLKHIFYACSPRCTVKLPSESDKNLEHIVNYGILRKGGRLTDRQALLQLQTDLIDHDFDEYSDI